jgi:uncharacterized protein YjiS (DUF1127 family)
MNAPLAKDQFQFSLGNLSYIGPEYEEASARFVKPEKHGAARFLESIVARMAEWRRRRQVIDEMAMMTDRELSDIGLSRSDLARVFDPNFAADHLRGRDYIAY